MADMDHVRIGAPLWYEGRRDADGNMDCNGTIVSIDREMHFVDVQFRDGMTKMVTFDMLIWYDNAGGQFRVHKDEQ